MSWYHYFQEYSVQQVEFSCLRQYQFIEVSLIIDQIQIKNPYLQFVSIPFLSMTYDESLDYKSYNGIQELGIKFFDTQLMLDKFLKIEKIYGKNIELNVKYDQLHTQNIHELEIISQLFKVQDIQFYDAYLIQLKNNQNYIVYDIEQIDFPCCHLNHILDKQNQFILKKIMDKLQNHLSWKYGESSLKNQNYYVKFTEDGQFQIKSFSNVIQCAKLKIKEYNCYYNEDQFSEYDNFVSDLQMEKLFERKVINSISQLDKQVIKIKKRIRIYKQNLTLALKYLAPYLLYYSKEIIQFIQKHPKYHLFSLVSFNKNCIIFKIYESNSKYLLRIEKFNSYKEAQIKKDQLKQISQLNEGIFLEIGEIELICVDQLWYILFEEYLTSKKNNYKLISFKKIDKIKNIFSNINCHSAYINLYLMVRCLYHFEMIKKFKFQTDLLISCQPYLQISDFNKISANKVIFSNPNFNEEQQTDSNCERLLQKFMNICYNCQFYDNFYQFDQTLNLNLKDYLYYQEQNNDNNTLDELEFQFPKMYYTVKQIEYFISIYEQFTNLSPKLFYFNKSFKIILSLDQDIEMFIEKNDVLNKIIQLEFQKCLCYFEQLQIYEKYLSKDNNIKYIKIKNTSENQENQQIQIEYLNNHVQKYETQWNSGQFFQKVQKLSMIPDKYMYGQINIKSFPSLQQIKIKYYNYNYNNSDIIASQFNILQIFDNIKTFQEIQIYNNYFKSLQKCIDQYIYGKTYENINNDKEIFLLMENIDSLFRIHYISDSQFIDEVKKQIQSDLKRFRDIRFESKIEIIDNKEQKYYSFRLILHDISELNLGKIEVFIQYIKPSTKKGFFDQYEPLVFSSVYQSLKSDISLYNFIVKWVYQQMEVYFLNKLGIKCIYNIDSQILLRIYKGQNKIKQMKLLYQQHICKEQCNILKFGEEVGLSNENLFSDLQELTFDFKDYEKNNKHVNQFLNQLYKVMTKKHYMNKITFIGYKIPIQMYKLKRIVQLQEIIQDDSPNINDDYFNYDDSVEDNEYDLDEISDSDEDYDFYQNIFKKGKKVKKQISFDF